MESNARIGTPPSRFAGYGLRRPQEQLSDVPALASRTFLVADDRQ
jgi:hypothetical protein